MGQSDPKPLSAEFLDGWNPHDLARDGRLVADLLESDAWKALMRAREDRLRFEQLVMMRGASHGEGHRYEFTRGQWSGLRDGLPAIAMTLIAAGKEAERELRRPDAAEAA